MKKLFLFGFLILVLLISGCAKQSEIVSINIVEWEKSAGRSEDVSDENCLENPVFEELYCREISDLTINLVINNYKGNEDRGKIQCHVRDNVYNYWYNPVEVNPGVNKIEAAFARDIRRETEVRVCCYKMFGDGSDEKCITKIIPRNNAFK